jgi:hypothetical protein
MARPSTALAALSSDVAALLNDGHRVLESARAWAVTLSTSSGTDDTADDDIDVDGAADSADDDIDEYTAITRRVRTLDYHFGRKGKTRPSPGDPVLGLYRYLLDRELLNDGATARVQAYVIDARAEQTARTNASRAASPLWPLWQRAHAREHDRDTDLARIRGVRTALTALTTTAVAADPWYREERTLAGVPDDPVSMLASLWLGVQAGLHRHAAAHPNVASEALEVLRIAAEQAAAAGTWHDGPHGTGYGRSAWLRAYVDLHVLSGRDPATAVPHALTWAADYGTALSGTVPTHRLHAQLAGTLLTAFDLPGAVTAAEAAHRAAVDAGLDHRTDPYAVLGIYDVTLCIGAHAAAVGRFDLLQRCLNLVPADEPDRADPEELEPLWTDRRSDLVDVQDNPERAAPNLVAVWVSGRGLDEGEAVWHRDVMIGLVIAALQRLGRPHVAAARASDALAASRDDGTARAAGLRRHWEQLAATMTMSKEDYLRSRELAEELAALLVTGDALQHLPLEIAIQSLSRYLASTRPPAWQPRAGTTVRMTDLQPGMRVRYRPRDT